MLSDPFILNGVPGHIRSNDGPKFIAKPVRAWLSAVGAQTAYITTGSPWENDYIESFTPRLRDEFLNGEIFYTLQEAKVLIEAWRCQHNTVRPHSSLGYRPPGTEVLLCTPPPAALKRAAQATAKPAQRPCNYLRWAWIAVRGLAIHRPDLILLLDLHTAQHVSANLAAWSWF